MDKPTITCGGPVIGLIGAPLVLVITGTVQVAGLQDSASCEECDDAARGHDQTQDQTTSR